MIIVSSVSTPRRVQRVFTRMTRLSLQIRSAFTLTIGHDQGEVAAAAQGDGIQLTQGNTSSPSQPYDFWWKGELWHIASVDNSSWSLLIIGEANNEPQHSSQSELTYYMR